MRPRPPRPILQLEPSYSRPAPSGELEYGLLYRLILMGGRPSGNEPLAPFGVDLPQRPDRGVGTRPGYWMALMRQPWPSSTRLRRVTFLFCSRTVTIAFEPWTRISATVMFSVGLTSCFCTAAWQVVFPRLAIAVARPGVKSSVQIFWASPACEASTRLSITAATGFLSPLNALAFLPSGLSSPPQPAAATASPVAIAISVVRTQPPGVTR